MLYLSLTLLLANMALFAYSASVGFGDTGPGGGAAGTLMTVSALFGVYCMVPGLFALPVLLYKHARFTTVTGVFFASFWPLACVMGVQFGAAIRAHNWGLLCLMTLCPVVQLVWAARLLLK